MYNMVSNALKYRSPLRRPIVILETETLSDEYIVLRIKDNGLGIKDEDKERLFSMYHRLHDHVEGTGVGMAIVKRIVDNNGGKIEVESEVGKGSEFKVYFKN